MNEDIIRMAKQAGGRESGSPELYDCFIMSLDDLKRFATLARAAEQARCCRIIYGMAGSDNVAQRTVDAIRGKE